MYASLYSTLLPLIADKKSGILSLFHDDGKTARIVVHEGAILSLETEQLQGAKAGHEIAMWIRFHRVFENTAVEPTENISAIKTTQFLEFLAKIENQAKEIQKIITFGNMTFKFITKELKGKKEFNPNELKVALALDGRTSIEEVVRRTEIADLIVLAHIYKLNRLGVLQRMKANDLLDEEQEASLLASITVAIAEYVGPAAELILDDAFDELESTPGMILKSELPLLIKNISDQLDGDDNLAFKKLAREKIRKY